MAVCGRHRRGGHLSDRRGRVRDALNWGRVLGVLMIVGGVIVLKTVSP